MFRWDWFWLTLAAVALCVNVFVFYHAYCRHHSLDWAFPEEGTAWLPICVNARP